MKLLASDLVMASKDWNFIAILGVKIRTLYPLFHFLDLRLMVMRFRRIKIKILELKCNVVQVIAINGKFPGPTINVTTNNNVVVNVRNKLDENLLIHW